MPSGPHIKNDENSPLNDVREASGRWNFPVLWTGQAVNLLGSQITLLAIPLLAVHSLKADSSQIGILQAFASAAYVFMGLPAGPLVDRFAKRRVLLVVNLLSAVLVGCLVVASRFGALALPSLYAVSLALGMCGVVAGVAFLSLVPEIVGSDRMVSVSSRLSVIQTSSQVVGPAVAGFVIGVIGTTDALGVDALSFVVAAASILMLRLADHPPATLKPQDTLTYLINAGIKFVWRNKTLRRITLASATCVCFGGIWQAALIVFLVRVLHVSDTVVGALVGLSALGGVAGGLTAPWLIRRFGRPNCLRWGLPLATIPGLLMAAAKPGWSVLLVAAADFCMMYGSIVFNIAQTSTRLELCPRDMLGRMNATIRTVVWSASTVGSLTGAGLGAFLSPRMLVLIGILGTICGSLLICASRPFPDASASE